MPRYFAYVVTACLGVTALGCGDNDSGSSPTSPQFAPTSTGCDLSTARGLVNSVFPVSARQTANNLLQAIQNAGSKSEAATNAGFDLFALIAANRPVPPTAGSSFVNAVLSCQEVGTIASAIDFTGALGLNGAFEVRGGSATDKTPAVSADGAWGLEPPLDLSGTTPVRLTWDQITNLPSPFNPATNPVNKRFLAYGSLITDPEFLAAYTKEVLVSSIFDWSTIPTATFSPGAVVGTCLTDEEDQQYLIQHHADADNGEIIPSATPSFCPSALTRSRAGGLGAFAFARRVLDFFRPQPLLAAALGTRPPGGSVGALSPHAAVNPKKITLSFPKDTLVKDGFTNKTITFKDGSTIRVYVEPNGGTDLNGALVELTAVANLGAPVIPQGNIAVTIDGVATFPELQLNKAGGYRLVAKIAKFGQNDAAGFNLTQATSNGFNLKQSK